MLTIKTLTKY